MGKKNYWHCLIGPIDRDKLPHGSDGPMRSIVRDQFHAITGEWDKHCWSGWGVDEDKKNRLLNVPDRLDKTSLTSSEKTLSEAFNKYADIDGEDGKKYMSKERYFDVIKMLTIPIVDETGTEACNFFVKSMKTTSATICVNCGFEKFLHKNI